MCVLLLQRLPNFAFRPLAIRRLVTNLVDNPVRYGGEPVEVYTQYLDGPITLRVIDSGPGVQSSYPNSFIKPFAREDTARGAQLRAGLGLSIVDRIAKHHGGTLTLTNRTEGGLEATATAART
jgi:two-component system, OmpR family, osmolarity sensor histidine kinase EnvZ